MHRRPLRAAAHPRNPNRHGRPHRGALIKDGGRTRAALPFVIGLAYFLVLTGAVLATTRILTGAQLLHPSGRAAARSGGSPEGAGRSFVPRLIHGGRKFLSGEYDRLLRPGGLYGALPWRRLGSATDVVTALDDRPQAPDAALRREVLAHVPPCRAAERGGVRGVA
jgi:hypothetical protein